MIDKCLSENFARNLKRACQERGITQRELARLSGVHYVTVSKIFTNRYLNPGLNLCETLAAAAGLDPERAFARRDDNDPNGSSPRRNRRNLRKSARSRSECS